MATRWTKEEDNYLIENYKDGNVKELPLLKHRSKEAIVRRATEFKLREYQNKDINKEFLKRLENENPYVFNNFEIISEYKKETEGIYLKDRFGIMKMQPRLLIKAKKVGIMSAVNKHKYFCNQLYEMGGEFSKLEVLSEYNGASKYVLLKDKYGLCNAKPMNIINKKTLPTIKSAVNKESYYLEQVKESNFEFYNDILEIGEYDNTDNIRIKTRHGWLLANKTSVLLGFAPTIVYAEDKDEYVRSMAREVHPTGYDYSKLKFSGKIKEKHEIYCNTHGYFSQDLTCHITMGQNCPQCVINQNAKIRTKSMDEFLNELKIKNKTAFESLEFIEEYKNSNAAILAKDKFGLINVFPSTVLNGGMPTIQCAVDKTNYVKNKIYDKRGSVYDLSKFTFGNTMDDKSIAVCEKHGEFTISPYDLMRYVGCPMCNMSVGEEKILMFLKLNNIIHEPQYRFKECKSIKPLPFDFYIPQHNLCIEFQGIQHYQVVDAFDGEVGFEKRKVNDNIKREFCKHNSIELLEIKYTEIKNIEEILKNKLSNQIGE